LILIRSRENLAQLRTDPNSSGENFAHDLKLVGVVKHLQPASKASLIKVHQRSSSPGYCPQFELQLGASGHGVRVKEKTRVKSRRGSLLDGDVAFNDVAEQSRGYTSTIATISIDLGSTITI
jgi:hypothetical protein